MLDKECGVSTAPDVLAQTQIIQSKRGGTREEGMRGIGEDFVHREAKNR